MFLWEDIDKDGLTHYWPGCSGSNVDVKSGVAMQNNCPAPQFVQDPSSPYASDKVFNFTRCVGVLPSGSYLATDYTISFLVYLNSYTYEYQIIFYYSKSRTTSGVGIGFERNSGQVGFSTQSDTQIKSGANQVSVRTWTYVAVTLAGSQGTIYFNGNVVGQGRLSANDPAVIRTFNQIGLLDSVHTINALIKEFKIYNRALSQAEIKQNANSNYCPNGLFVHINFICYLNNYL